MKLCRHYLSTDPAATGDYVRAYREMWDAPTRSLRRVVAFDCCRDFPRRPFH